MAERHGHTADNPYLRALRSLRGTFVLVALFSAAINLLMLTGPVYMLQIYDRVLSSGSVATLLGLFGIVVLLYAFLGLYDFCARGSCRGRRCGSTARWARRRFVVALRASRPGGGRGSIRAPSRSAIWRLVRGFMSGGRSPGFSICPGRRSFWDWSFLIHPWLGWLTLAGAGVVAVAALLNQDG